MTERTDRERYRALLEELREHNYQYHVIGQSTIDDNTYDLLYRDLLALEEEHPELVDPASLTARVGAAPEQAFAPVHHREPMFSLDNAMDADEFRAFDDRQTQGDRCPGWSRRPSWGQVVSVDE